MKETLVLAALFTVLFAVALLGVWWITKVIADNVSDYEVVRPEVGVRCIVVSRMFNTSVDCWKTTTQFN